MQALISTRSAGGGYGGLPISSQTAPGRASKWLMIRSGLNAATGTSV